MLFKAVFLSKTCYVDEKHRLNLSTFYDACNFKTTDLIPIYQHKTGSIWTRGSWPLETHETIRIDSRILFLEVTSCFWQTSLECGAAINLLRNSQTVLQVPLSHDYITTIVSNYYRVRLFTVIHHSW